MAAGQWRRHDRPPAARDKTARYEAQTGPLFEAKVKELCPDCEIIYSNANQDAAKQQQQAEAALTKGAKVLVLDPVDAKRRRRSSSRPNAQDVPVISYDRLIAGRRVDYYVSFDNARSASSRATALLDKLRRTASPGPIVMINGAPPTTTPSSSRRARTASSTRAGSRSPRSTTRRTGAPDKAQTGDGAGDHRARQGRLRRRLRRQRRHRRRRDRGDEGGRHRPQDRPITGQDAELAGDPADPRRRAVHDVYKAIKPQAETAAELAVALVKGEKPPATS